MGWVHDRPAGLACAPDAGCEGEGWRGTPQLECVPEGPKVWGRGARIPSFFSFNDFQSRVKIGGKHQENLAPNLMKQRMRETHGGSVPSLLVLHTSETPLPAGHPATRAQVSVCPSVWRKKTIPQSRKIKHNRNQANKNGSSRPL